MLPVVSSSLSVYLCWSKMWTHLQLPISQSILFIPFCFSLSFLYTLFLTRSFCVSVVVWMIEWCCGWGGVYGGVVLHQEACLVCGWLRANLCIFLLPFSTHVCLSSLMVKRDSIVCNSGGFHHLSPRLPAMDDV